MHDPIDASEVLVTFQGEDGTISRVPVSHLLNEVFTLLFKLEERISALEGGDKKKPSPIITLDTL